MRLLILTSFSMPAQVTQTCIRYQNYGRLTMPSTSLRVAKIDKDYLANSEEQFPTRVGTEWTEHELKEYFARQNLGEELTDLNLEDNKTRFRLLDDDREVYYGGWLLNDDQCLVQMMVSAWGTYDAGAIHIEIKKDGEWVMEIG